jgi:hypothetical protein
VEREKQLGHYRSCQWIANTTPHACNNSVAVKGAAAADRFQHWLRPSHYYPDMFSIELDVNQSTQKRNKAIAEQRSKIYDLTDFECRVFAEYCRIVKRDEVADFVISFVKQRSEKDDDVYIGDEEIMATNHTLQHDAGGGKRNIRGTKSMT